MKKHLKPADPALQAWLFEAERKFSAESQPNRMVRMYGPAGVDKKCKDCRNLLRVVLRSGKVFFKCLHVGDTRGPGTDFRANWDACARFIPRQQRERTTAGNRIHYAGGT